MKFRQVHLDFHTSECIEGIGSRFDKEQFKEALQRGHVDSITLFSKCHHGWAYHPSEKNEQHPHLHFDLLQAQMEAAHEIGVKTPVYLSAGFDEKLARRHPEWLVRNQSKTFDGTSDFNHPGYHLFCMNTPYLDYLLEQIREVVERYDADGIFLDIVGVRRCYCQNCINTLIAEGKDPENEDNITELGERVYANYTARVREVIDSVKPGLPVFHNGGHIRRGRRDLAHMDSHLELESLPTSFWGYDHFPMSASYAQTLGMDYLGMTGKFHTNWGEFGGFKHPNALRYEAALSAAFGAKCSIGDQLHPLGFMDMATYDLIGKAYREIEAKEPWLDHVTPVTDIAVLSTEAVDNYYGASEAPHNGNISDNGAIRIMLEGNYLFNMIDTEAPLDGYKLLILPDRVKLDTALYEKIAAFVKKGGKVLASGTSALMADTNSFAFDLGAVFKGKSEFQPVYFRPRFEMAELGNAAFVIYAPSCDIEAVGEVIADRENPYFNRATEHFCSHQHTPNDPTSRMPAITIGKEGGYISTEIFYEYADMGSLIAKKLAMAAIDAILGNSKTVVTDLPAQGVTTLMKQEAENRYIQHLLYVSTVKRGNGRHSVEIIEDALPLYDIHTAIRVDHAPKSVTYVNTEGKKSPLHYTYENGVVRVTVPKLFIHGMISIEFS